MRKLSSSSLEYPSWWMIFICLTMVDFPDSPEPVVSHFQIVRSLPVNPPRSKILHSFLNFRESSSSCLSMALLRSLLPLCSGASARAALNPWPPEMLPPAVGGGVVADAPLVGEMGAAGWTDPARVGVAAGAAEAGAGLGSAADVDGRLGCSVVGVDMHPPMVVD